MARPKRELTRDREREAWRLRLLGWTQERIAEELGIAQQTVCDMLQRMEKRLYGEFVAQAEEEKARQHAQLHEIYREAMEKWQRSCEDRVQVQSGRVKVSELGGRVCLPDLETRTGQSGNPALLEKAMKALADIRAIWGLDAPAKSEVAGPGGGPVAITEVIVELPQKENEC